VIRRASSFVSKIPRTVFDLLRIAAAVGRRRNLLNLERDSVPPP
jgi:hypothetical protein